MDAFYLEFDDERSGSFEPLKYMAEGKKVVLGLVYHQVLPPGRLGHRDCPHPRSRKVDRLCLSPQCGFASCEIGNKLTGLQQ